MSKTTENLELFEYDTQTDGKQKFNITKALNNNFDKIDTATGKLTELVTEDKSSLVKAINEAYNNIPETPPTTTIKSYHDVVYGVAKTVAFGGDYSNLTAIDISSYADGTYYVYKVDTTDEETQEVSSSISITTNASETALQLAKIKIADGALSEVLTSLQYTTETPLQEVKEHTESSAKDIDYDETGKLNLVPFNFAGLNYSDYATVTANTVSTYSKSGKFFASSITTVKYKYAGDTTFFDIPYAQEIDVRAGDSINSPVAGRMVFYY